MENQPNNIAEAEAILRALHRQRLQIDLAIQAYERYLRIKREQPLSLSDVVDELITRGALERNLVAPDLPQAGVQYAGMAAWEAALTFLKGAQKPQRLNVIVEALTRGGYETSSTRLNALVHGAMKAKPDIFRATARGVWGLVGLHDL